MASLRKIAFRNEEFYHLFNRGIERRNVFLHKKDYVRAQNLVKFYRHKDIPVRFSQVLLQPDEIRRSILETVYRSEQVVDILAYCFMPNHFHFLVRQNFDGGITTFIANFTNAYTKYFNTKNEREGPLFQGVFKAVHVESEEQLLHLSRYIHLNPVVSSIIGEKELDGYEWSSYSEYLFSSSTICEKETVLGLFASVDHYRQFVTDQIDYAKKLDAVKHLTME